VSTFHELRISEVEQLTPVSVALTFTVPEPLRQTYAFRPGQHVTVLDGALRRSYSLCSTPRELAEQGRLVIGVKRVPGGAFSTRAQQLVPGATLPVLPPLGHFTTAVDAGRSLAYGAIVAGSGVTPVLSIVATVLATEPDSTFTLLVGNRGAAEVMFADALADLKDRHPRRLQLVHVLSRESQPGDLLSGRLDAERITRLIEVYDLSRLDEWFLCGPLGVVRAAREALERAGATGRVHVELFHAEETVTAQAPPGAEVSVSLLLDGRTTEFEMGRGERVLDAALRHRGELPFACKGGVCSTCRARVTEGSVQMAVNWALEPDELAAGYVLTCQASPTSDHLTVDYDA
jgi:ring-1,2-phenylacetyl-CoA epoxidase subunit PaaE